jgi:hypothetical protein
MNREEFYALKRGDIVKPIGGCETYVVSANYGERVTAATTIDITNPGNWMLVQKPKDEDSSKKRTPIEINDLVKTCSGCPSQWEFYTFDKRPVYVRYRWGYLSVRIGAPNAEMSEAYTGVAIIGRQLGDNLDGSIDWKYVKEHLDMLSKEHIHFFLGMNKNI